MKARGQRPKSYYADPGPAGKETYQIPKTQVGFLVVIEEEAKPQHHQSIAQDPLPVRFLVS
jgi:hypothetical protein